MRHWLVRVDGRNLSVSRDRRTLTVTSRRPPRIAARDLVVLLDSAEGGVFRFEAEVIAVQRPPTPEQSALDELDDGEGTGDLDGEGNELRQTIVKLSESTKLPEGLTREAMQYSLTFVRSLTAPRKHFVRAYRTLPPDDYRTLRRGEAFVARSAFAILLRSLPAQIRIAFQVDEILKAPEEQAGNSTFRERLGNLVSFIDQRVIAAGRLLAEITKQTSLLELNVGGHIPVDHVFVGPAEDKRLLSSRPDSIAVQSEYFSKLDELAHLQRPESRDQAQSGFLAQVLKDLDDPKRRPDEQRFETLFSKIR